MSSRCWLIPCLALGWPLAAISAQELSEDVIIVATDGLTSGTRERSSNARAERADEVVYASVYHHPQQTFVDSDLGPLPLWTETVYDDHGNPQPRFPDLFTKAFLDDPSETTALAYLESQRVRARRYLQASQIMQQVAVAQGYVTPEAFRPPAERLSNSRALVPPYQVRAQDWGVKVLDPQQARLAGLQPQEVPATPGRSTTRPVEVVMFWDHRCAFSQRGMRDYAAFGEQVYAQELGPRIMTISLDNDSASTRAQLDYLEYTGVHTGHLENWLDQTDLAAAVNVRFTPTYLFLDRRSGKIQRYEGMKDLAFLQQALLNLVDHGESAWSEVAAEWFRPTAVAPGARRPTRASAESDSERAPPQSDPILPPPRRLRAWNPDGQSEQ
jgi:hypothetical protein